MSEFYRWKEKQKQMTERKFFAIGTVRDVTSLKKFLTDPTTKFNRVEWGVDKRANPLCRLLFVRDPDSSYNWPERVASIVINNIGLRYQVVQALEEVEDANK